METTSTIEGTKRKDRLLDWISNNALTISIILLILMVICLIAFVIWISASKELFSKDKTAMLQLIAGIVIIAFFSISYCGVIARIRSSRINKSFEDLASQVKLINNQESELAMYRKKLEKVLSDLDTIESLLKESSKSLEKSLEKKEKRGKKYRRDNLTDNYYRVLLADEDTKAKYDDWIKMAFDYSLERNYDKALSAYSKAIELSEKKNDASTGEEDMSVKTEKAHDQATALIG